MGKLSLKCANAFQVLGHLQLKAGEVTLEFLELLEFIELNLLSRPVLSTPGLKLLQIFPQLFFIGKLWALKNSHMTRFEYEVRIYCQSRTNLKVVKWG